MQQSVGILPMKASGPRMKSRMKPSTPLLSVLRKGVHAVATFALLCSLLNNISNNSLFDDPACQFSIIASQNSLIQPVSAISEQALKDIIFENYQPSTLPFAKDTFHNSTNAFRKADGSIDSWVTVEVRYIFLPKNRWKYSIYVGDGGGENTNFRKADGSGIYVGYC
jgi:hypothetical protein